MLNRVIIYARHVEGRTEGALPCVSVGVGLVRHSARGDESLPRPKKTLAGREGKEGR